MRKYDDFDLDLKKVVNENEGDICTNSWIILFFKIL